MKKKYKDQQESSSQLDFIRMDGYGFRLERS